MAWPAPGAPRILSNNAAGPGRGPRRPHRWMGRAVTLYCVVVVGIIAAEAPRLLAARAGLGFPTVEYYGRWPVAVLGIYFFTALSLAGGLVVSRSRGAGWVDAVILGVLGVAGFEALYGIGYALLQGDPEHLLLQLGLPVTGWAGMASWVLLEALVASLAIYRWRWGGVDRWVLVALAGFAGSMVVWKLLLDLAFPPFETNAIVYPINTAAELLGSLILPLVFTARGESAEVRRSRRVPLWRPFGRSDRGSGSREAARPAR